MENDLVSYFFPKGFRLMVVDDDERSLKIAQEQLSKCKYKVTTCKNPKSALSILQKKTCDFDLLLTDVYMHDMNGFELLDVVYGELRIPVGLMSVDKNWEIAMQSILRGACFFFEKPLNSYLVTTLWRLVAWTKFSREEKTKRKGLGKANIKGASHRSKKLVEHLNDDYIESKKPRIVWTPFLQQKFQNALNQLDSNDAVPSKITELMNVKGVERQHVASHLQILRQNQLENVIFLKNKGVQEGKLSSQMDFKKENKINRRIVVLVHYWKKYRIQMNRGERQKDGSNTKMDLNYQLPKQQRLIYGRSRSTINLGLNPAISMPHYNLFSSQALPGVTNYPLSHIEHVQACLQNLVPSISMRLDPPKGVPSSIVAQQVHQVPSTKSLFGMCDNISTTHGEDSPLSGGVSESLQLDDSIENYFDGPIEIGFTDGTLNNILLEHNFWEKNNVSTPKLTVSDYGINSDGLALSETKSLELGKQQTIVHEMVNTSKNAEADAFIQLLEKFIADDEQLDEVIDEASPTNMN